MSRRIWLRVASVLAGAILGLALIEAVLAGAGLPREEPFLQEFYGRDFKLMCYDANPSGALDIDLRDPKIRARFEKKLPALSYAWQATPFAVEVAFNSQGFRDVEFGPRREGTERVVVVGDSFTYGHGLPEPACHPRRLEAILRERGRPVEVLNAGSRGDDLDRIGPLASRLLGELAPDVLVYGYFLNDPLGAASHRSREVQPMLDAAWLHPKASTGRLGLGARPFEGPRMLEFVRRFARDRELTHATLAWYRAIHSPSFWAPTGAALVELAREASRRNVRFVWAILPIIWDLDGDYPLAEVHDEVSRFGRENGIEVLDLLPALRGHADADLMLHPRDRHPSPLYTELVAEALADRLLDSGS